MGKIPQPPGMGWVGGDRDGWVGWPQISAFWATRHPPPPRGVWVRFLGGFGFVQGSEIGLNFSLFFHNISSLLTLCCAEVREKDGS